jgi:hypothetical protein
MRFSMISTNNFSAFRDNQRKALEYFTGSPVKKEAKLFETCAIALGMGNSDRLNAALSQSEVEQNDAYTLAQEGLCPFTLEPLDASGVEPCGSSVYFKDGLLNVCTFPRGMPMIEQIMWASRQPDEKVRVVGQTPSVFAGIETMGEEPHWHAAVAGYREPLSNWFMSSEDNQALTVAYWHTDSDFLQGESLSEQLAGETHYELVLTRSESRLQQTLTLYRIFKLGSKWHLSRDAEAVLDLKDPHDFHGAPGTTLLVDKITSTLVENALSNPSRFMASNPAAFSTLAVATLAKRKIGELMLSKETITGFQTRHKSDLEGVADELTALAKTMLESFAMGDQVDTGSVTTRWVRHPLDD